MTWDAKSARKDRLPPDWEVIRSRVLARDGYRCQWREGDRPPCGWKANQVDHIIPNDDDSLSNLRSLCSYHHKRKSAAEGGAANAAKRASVKSRFRRVETNPGWIKPPKDI